MANQQSGASIASLVREFNANNPATSTTELTNLILKAHPHLLFQTVKRSIEKTRQKLKSEVEIEVVDEPAAKWEVIDGNYEWVAKHGKVSLSVEFIDQIFYEFSTHGLNLTAVEIINKHNIAPSVWHSLKNTLQLYKQSNVFSPHTWQNTPLEEREAMVAEKMNALLGNTQTVVVKQYTQQVTKQARQIIKDNATKTLFADVFMEQFASLMPEARVVTLKVCQRPADALEWYHAAIADLHSGSDVKKLVLTEDFDTEILKARLQEVADEINSKQAKRVAISILGDLIESFLGLNHKTSWRDMEKAKVGAAGLFSIYDILVWFLCQIENLEELYGLTGNHCRASSSRDEDPEGEIGLILYGLLERVFSPKIKVVYHSTVLSYTIDGIQYISTHGHKGISRLSPWQLIVKYGDPTKFNVVLKAHDHSVAVDKKHGWSSKHLSMTIPSIFGGNTWSEGEGYDTTPGFTTFQRTKSGKPATQIIPL